MMCRCILILLLAGLAQAQVPDTLWSYQCGGDGNDYPARPVVMPDGRIIACGGTYSFGGIDAPYLVGLTPEGQRLFARIAYSAPIWG